jgi:IPT/TIG domain
MLKPINVFYFLFSQFIFSCTKTPDPTPPVIVLTPSIISFVPTSAKSGDTIIIVGSNLLKTSALDFGGVTASSFSVLSDSKILAVVSSGASSNLSITTPNGIATLGGFTFLTNTNVPQYLLVRWGSDNPNSRTLNFEYDNNKKLNKVFGAGAGNALIYNKNDTLSHVVFQEGNINDPSVNIKRSIIFSYDANKKCTKLFYKKPVNNILLTAPYLSDTTDNEFERKDSLIYSTTNQLLEIWGKDNVGSSSPLLITKYLVKFIYPSLQSETPNKLQSYYIGYNNFLAPMDEMVITTDTVTNPLYKTGWFLPYLNNVLSNGLRFTLPSLTPEYTGITELPRYLCMVKKCIKKYNYTAYAGSSPYSFVSENYVSYYPNGLFQFKSIFDKPYDPTFPGVTYIYELK